MSNYKGKINRLKLLPLFFILFFNGCGFEFVYKKSGQKDNEYNRKLAAVIIKKSRNVYYQVLKNNLYDLLNPARIEVKPKYALILNIEKNTVSTYTRPSGASGRNRINIIVTYELRHMDNYSLISSGSSSFFDNYDVSENNRYGNSKLEDFATKNILKIIAQDLRNSIVNDLNILSE